MQMIFATKYIWDKHLSMIFEVVSDLASAS